MKYSAIIAILSLSLVACSGSKSAQKVNEDVAQIELTETNELLDSDPVVEEMMGGALMDDEAAAPIIAEVSNSGMMEEYRVQKNETLMLIAFKLYGNYNKWKELANLNRSVLGSGTHVKEGMTLKYYTPSEQFVWNPEGNPYLIKSGDTLGSISNQVYQTTNKWKVLWDNNRPLIKDPNKIFAGFTIYYPDLNRDIASEQF